MPRCREVGVTDDLDTWYGMMLIICHGVVRSGLPTV